MKLKAFLIKFSLKQIKPFFLEGESLKEKFVFCVVYNYV